MEVLREWDLEVDADQVLRGQGADPAVIRQRSPKLVEIAERALEEGLSLVKPVTLYHRVKVESVLHERIQLEGGQELKSPLLAKHLPAASEVVIILCTVGDDLESKVSKIMASDPSYALALDGVGSATVEVLANAVCRKFELEAQANGLETSIPLSPGMLDWPVEVGQPQVFNLLNAEEVGVRLTPAWVMLPRKSLTMILGVGEKMAQAGVPCDYCSMRETCKYQDHYA